MGNVLAIAQKELRSYFASPIAYVVIGLFALLYGYFFVALLTYFVRTSMQAGQFGGPQAMNVNQQVIRGVMQNVTILVLFLMPMVTMRSYAEEKRSGTIELLLTSPLTDFEIIAGKFLGTVVLYLALLAVTAIYVAMLFVYGRPEWRPIVAGYLGLFLMGSCFISIGLFISSLTKNQMVAGAATFVVGLLFWIVSWFSESAGPTTASVLSYLSITEHFDDFGKGIIDTKHLIYYLSFISFGLFLTLKSVDSERWRG
jgi:ABC-2 type transport system permease protein